MEADDEYADALGVINALERTCELESKLRQAIQDTHPLQTTLDWDFSAADREREALLAISEQLEYLEDKLREYRNMESHEVDNKAVVLSQLDNVRRELVEVTQNRLPFISFGKEVAKEVLLFANISDGAGEGEGSELQSPQPTRGGRAQQAQQQQQQRQRPYSGGGGREGEGARRATSEVGERVRTFTALMSPSQRRVHEAAAAAAGAAGSPAALRSPGALTRSYDPSRASSPYDGAAASPPRAQPSRSAGGYGGGGAGSRLPPAPRRQINLDLSSMNAGGAGAGPASAPARPGPSIFADQRAQQRAVYSFSGGGNGNGAGREREAAGGAARAQGGAAAGAGGGSGYGSRPTSARTTADPGSGRASGGSGGYSYQPPAGSRADAGNRILNRMDPAPIRARSSSPISLRAEDIYGAVNGAPRAGSSGSSRLGGQQEFGGMVRIRDMLQRAEKDLTQVQEEREARRSPHPPRIFGEDLSNRFNDEEGGNATPASTYLSPAAHSSRRGPAASAPAAGGGAGGGGGAVGGYIRPAAARERGREEERRGREEEGRGQDESPKRRVTPVTIRDRFDPQPAPSYGAAASRTAWGGREGGSRRRGKGGGAGRLVAGVGRVIKGVAILAVKGAVLGVSLAAVGKAAQWAAQQRPKLSLPRPKKQVAIDLPPWLVSSPIAPPPGFPQRSRAGKAAGGSGGSKQPARPAPARRSGGGRPAPLPGAPLDFVQLSQSPVIHVQPLPEGDLFPSMPPPDISVAMG